MRLAVVQVDAWCRGSAQSSRRFRTCNSTGLMRPASTGGLAEVSGLRFVANHLDVVPVRTNDESRMVFPAVVRA